MKSSFLYCILTDRQNLILIYGDIDICRVQKILEEEKCLLLILLAQLTNLFVFVAFCHFVACDDLE